MGPAPRLPSSRRRWSALAALAGAAAAEVRILALGDSLTAGYGLPDGEGFVPRLEAWLAANGAADVEIVNGGVSGDTSAGGLARIGWALGDDIDAVIVELGANDMLRGIDPGVTRANLDGILNAIDAAGPAGDPRRPAGAAELSEGLPRRLQGDVPRPRRGSTTRSTTRPSSAAWETDAASARSCGCSSPTGCTRTPRACRRSSTTSARWCSSSSSPGAAAVIRAFAAIALPEAVRFELMLVGHGLPVPKPVPPENLHLTLVFLGELPEPVVADIDLALAAVRAPGFELGFAGLGLFGGAKPRVAFAASPTARRSGTCRPRSRPRRAAPAWPSRRGATRRTSRWRGCPSAASTAAASRPAVAGRPGPVAPAFRVEDFRLYRSRLGAGSAVYEELARYPLG